MDQQRVFLSVPLVALELFGEQEQKQAYLDFYDQITQACEKRGMWVYPYQYGHPVEHDFIHEDVIYEETRQQIEDSDFVIAYVGIPSAGVSIGIEIANSLSLPVILLYEEGTKPLISKMILGCPAARDRIVAPDLESLIVKFDDRFNAVRQRISTVQVTGVSGVRDEFLKLLNTAHGESGLNLAQAGSRIGADRSYVFRLLKGEIQAPGRNQVIKLCVWAWKLDLKQTNAILKAGGYDDL